MPRRSTHYYTSDNAQPNASDVLYSYYCKYSGKHVMTTNVDIDTLPRRITDRSFIIDSEKYLIKLYTTDGGIRCIKREDKVEKQYRINIGDVPVAYKSSPEDRHIFIFYDALTAFDQTITAKGILIPPCIMQTNNSDVGLLIGLEDDFSSSTTGFQGIQAITADFIVYTAKNKVGSHEFTEEILSNFQQYLDKRRSQLKLKRGFAPMQKLIVVEDAEAEVIYKQLLNIVGLKERNEKEF